jgi:hypothetical protein
MKTNRGIAYHQKRLSECRNLHKLIKETTHDKDILMLLDVVGASSHEGHQQQSLPDASVERQLALDLFILQSVVQCLLQDKEEVFPILLSMYTSTQAIIKQEELFVQDGDGQRALFFLRDLSYLKQSMEPAQSTALLEYSFVDALFTMLQNEAIGEMNTNGSRLRILLSKYAARLESWREVEEEEGDQRKRLACLLVLFQVPPLSVLLEIKKLVAGCATTSTLATLEAVVHSVLEEMGHKVASEIVRVFTEAWCV